MTKTRIFFASDIHGSEKCFRKFVNSGKFYKADVIILGGDITGKMVVPIVEKNDGTFKTRFFGRDWLSKTREEAESLTKDIRQAGYYPYFTTPEEMDELTENRAKVDELFSQLMIEYLSRWLSLAEEKLKDTGIKCFITPGNDDRLDVNPVFEESGYVVNPEGNVVNIDEHHEMISSGYTNITPWNCPRDIPDEEVGAKIEAMAAEVEDMSNCIFNFHCPPYDTHLDQAPKLEDLKPVISAGGQPIMVSVGCVSVRKAIEKYKPLLGLHGHIHESKGATRIGRTMCLNPGSEYGEGILKGVLVNLNKKGIKSYQFTSG